MGQSDQVRRHQGGVINCPTFHKSRSANGDCPQDDRLTPPFPMAWSNTGNGGSRLRGRFGSRTRCEEVIEPHDDFGIIAERRRWLVPVPRAWLASRESRNRSIKDALVARPR